MCFVKVININNQLKYVVYRISLVWCVVWCMCGVWCVYVWCVVCVYVCV